MHAPNRINLNRKIVFTVPAPGYDRTTHKYKIYGCIGSGNCTLYQVAVYNIVYTRGIICNYDVAYVASPAAGFTMEFRNLILRCPGI